MAQGVASRWITSFCAVVRIMQGYEMDKVMFGVIAGFIICVIMVVSTEADGRKDAVKDGWIKIDGEVYTLRKADVVEVKSQN